MEALLYRRQIARYLVSRALYGAFRSLWSPRWAPLRQVQLPLPTPPGAGWCRLRVRRSGICGSDLRLVTGEDSLYLEPEATYPFVPGHEVVGELDSSVAPEHPAEGGSSSRRVAVWPVLGCRVREHATPCGPCAGGWEGLCERRDEGWPGRGCSIGFNRETGGGWAEACLAHRSQLWSLPDSISDDDAVLLDPAAAALAALLRGAAPRAEATLVIGGGPIALLVARLHAALGLAGRCQLLVRHEFLRARAEPHASAALVRSEAEFHEWASSEGMEARRASGYGFVYRGVFDRVIDCAGTRTSFMHAIRAVRPGGECVLISAPTSLRNFDPTPLWYREITCRGVYQYGPVPWEGSWRHPYDVLIPLVARGALRLGDLVTHRFELGDYVAAFRAATSRARSHAIKIVFTPPTAGGALPR